MKREIVRRAGLLLLMSLLCVSGAAVRAEAQSEPAGQNESAVQSESARQGEPAGQTELAVETESASQEASEVQREIYIPKELAHNDFSDESAEWCFARSKESEHFVLFWQAGFGDDPGSEDIPSWMRVDTGDLLEKAEQFYRTNTEALGFGQGDWPDSYLNRYKMMIFLYWQEEWLATGAGYDDVIGALWVNPSTCQPAGEVIAHEIGHCFQYQIYCDRVLNGLSRDEWIDLARARADGLAGFRYSCEKGEGNGFWEQCAQWQSFQDYPAEAFTLYQKDTWSAHYHRAFEHEWSRYQSYWLQYELAREYGIDAVGRVWREAEYPEDALAAIRRIFMEEDEEKYAKFLYDYAAHAATFDFEPVREFGGSWFGVYKTAFYPVEEEDGTWQRVAYASCPDEGGFNVIRLRPEEGQETVTVSFRELPEGSPLAPDDPGECHGGEEGKTVVKTVSQYNEGPSGSSETAGTDKETGSHHYGFVAHLTDGSRVYSEMYSAAEDTVSFAVPEKTRVLYFIVAGTPAEHAPHKWDNREDNDRQLPYEISVESKPEEMQDR